MRVVAFLVLTGALAAQTFEVASVKVNRSGRNSSSTSRSGGQLVFENVTMREAVSVAYGISSDRRYALTGPAWIDDERYDFVAKVAADVPRAQVLRMLQALLEERFQLRLHRETRELRVYRLTIARGGHKLKPSSIQDGSFTFNTGRFTATGQSMTDLADKLTRPFAGLDAPVIDATGLDGGFDFTLNWTPDGMPSIFDALQEQLGLKLEAGKSNVEVLVIDHAERVPKEN